MAKKLFSPYKKIKYDAQTIVYYEQKNKNTNIWSCRQILEIELHEQVNKQSNN